MNEYKKQKETKRERLKRLFLTKKAGIDIDESELYIIKSTPSQIMQLKNNDSTNKEPIKHFNAESIDSMHSENELSSKPEASNFSFGSLSTSNSLNSAIPGAMDKAYKLKDGIKVISTRTNKTRKRKNAEVVLLDITEDTESKNETSSESEEEEQVIEINEPPRKKRKSLWGLKDKSTKDLQTFLECASDDDALAMNAMERERKFTVKVHRLPRITESRMALPILGEEYKIMECIKDNDVVLICGETGLLLLPSFTQSQ